MLGRVGVCLTHWVQDWGLLGRAWVWWSMGVGPGLLYVAPGDGQQRATSAA